MFATLHGKSEVTIWQETAVALQQHDLGELHSEQEDSPEAEEKLDHHRGGEQHPRHQGLLRLQEVRLGRHEKIFYQWSCHSLKNKIALFPYSPDFTPRPPLLMARPSRILKWSVTEPRSGGGYFLDYFLAAGYKSNLKLGCKPILHGNLIYLLASHLIQIPG